MIDFGQYERAITERLQELGVRLHDIDAELGQTKDKDLAEQAVDLEDDEVLEGVGHVAQKEVAALQAALKRIKAQTYGTCLSCEEPISPERLKAVLYAPLCKACANRTAS